MIPGMLLAEGEILDGKYRAEKILGEGGMGYVVAAWHEQLEQRVALKLLRPETLAEPSFVARFHREARAAAKIKSEHVCRVLDVGLSPAHGPYMVMEHLEGQDLQTLLRRVGPRPVDQAVTWVLHASHAIAEAHSRGIVHRDLKPANLFLANRPDGAPVVKVLDFGISKVIGATNAALQESLTETSMFMGSYAYMSPEQARNAKDVDGRVDIWALGAILQKIITGTTPFVADSAAAYVAQIVADPPARLREKQPDVPEALEKVVLRCLEKDREARFQNVAELAAALLPFAPSCETLVQAIARLCSLPLEPGLPSGSGGPIPEPAPSSRSLDAAPSPPRPTPPARGKKEVVDERVAASNTPTKPFDFAAMGAILQAGADVGRTPVSGAGMAPPSGPGLTPISGIGTPPVSGPGLTPISGIGTPPGLGPGLTPLSAVGQGAGPAPTGSLPLPPPPSGATPIGLSATPGPVAPWVPMTPELQTVRSPRMLIWASLAGAAFVATVVVVLAIGLAATDSTLPTGGAAEASSESSAPSGAEPPTVPSSAGREARDSAANGADAGDSAPPIAGSAVASAASSVPKPTGAPSASAAPQPKSKPTGRWDPFAHP
jgi:serine/threonine-protein kinase